MKTLTYIQLSLCFSVMLFLNACQKENRCDCIKRTGEIIKEVRTLEGFDRILIEDNLNVFISEDPSFEVTIEAGENIAPLIETKVINGTLFIRNKNKCNWARSYKKPLNVYIKMPHLTYLTSDGTGDVKSLNAITSDTLDIQTMNSGSIELTVNNSLLLSHMHGSGDITLYGSTNEHAISIGGTAYIHASGFQTSYTYIHSFTLGLSYIRASDLLIARLDEKGDVYCYGDPATVQKTLNAKGQLYLK